ncbi:MAG: ABC transporter ATP-binding protein [Chloroflexi bacterium RBG_13_56_8b]|nr:MAG: ABC transporter ATP-binding protein [Chloroflexi bacterium RBG_13_56_8b]
MRMLEGEKVTKYFGGLAAVSQVDFYVEQGEIFGLIGPNGAGKTTLFNLISGAFTPKSGVIKFKGKRISGLKPYKICRMGMARTFQEVKIFGNVPAVQNVALGALFGTPKSVSTAEATKEAEELLDFVGFAVPKNIPAGGLTLVNQKRVEIARALATKADMLLLDEVMAGLTPTETAEAMELVKRIRDRGVTVFLIEHVMRAIMGVCDRIMVLHHGEKIADGTPQEISTSKKVIEVYLGE